MKWLDYDTSRDTNDTFSDKISKHVHNYLCLSVDGAAMRAGVQTGDRIIKVTYTCVTV